MVSQKAGLYICMFLLAISCTSTKSKNPHEQLAGMYKLHVIEVPDLSGTWIKEESNLGSEGFILYDGLGHMAVHIIPGGYQNFTWIGEEETINKNKLQQKIDSMSIDELKSAVKEFASNYVYTANYTISDSSGIIQHQRLTHTIPSSWNSTVKRSFRFSGDTIILENIASSRRLKWIRQK